MLVVDERLLAHLRVSATDIEHDRIRRSRHTATHLDVRHAVVDGRQRPAPQRRQAARDDGAHLQRRAHARPARVRDEVDVGRCQLRVGQRLAHQCDHVVAVVRGRLRRTETLAGRRRIRATRIGQHLVTARDADADLVRTALDAEHGHFAAGHCDRLSKLEQTTFAQNHLGSLQLPRITIDRSLLPTRRSFPLVSRFDSHEIRREFDTRSTRRRCTRTATNSATVVCTIRVRARDGSAGVRA